MPRFVGCTRSFTTQIDDNANRVPGFVKVTLAQVDKIAALLESERISNDGVFLASLDTTDRGSRGMKAKRWNRWFVSVDAIRLMLEKGEATPSMINRAS